MTKKLTFLILLVLMVNSLPIFAIDSTTEIQLLVKALSEGAVNKEQKSAVSRFFMEISLEKKKEADRYREMTKVSQGGKAMAQEARNKAFLDKARILDAESKNYEAMASNSDNSNLERIAKLQ